jgi:8-oxo-dGTP pyrophosphatase MutT (NUDIX family)
MAKTHRASGRAVVIKDGRLLLTKYKNGQYYNFPGGGVEEGETLAECTKREVLEESGITVVVEDMLFTLEVETKRCGISGDPHISVFFVALLTILYQQPYQANPIITRMTRQYQRLQYGFR